MTKEEPEIVVYEYSHQQAVADGVLVELFKNRWSELSNGKPILASSHIFEAFSLAAFFEMWNEFVLGKKGETVEPGYMHETKMNDRKVWIIFDGGVYTFMFPEDY